MNETTTEKRTFFAAVLTVICIFCFGQCPGSIDAAIAKIAAYFALSSSSALYIVTISSVVSVLSGLAVGFIAGKKIGFRQVILFCAFMELLGGTLPYFSNSFPVLLALRAIHGIGIGGMMSLENAIASLLVPAHSRAKVLGIATFFGFGTNCILQFLGGIFADISWQCVFLVHILLVIPFILLLIFCPAIPKIAPQANNDTAKGKLLTHALWSLCVIMALIACFISPLLIGCSFLSEPIDPSATVAGIVAVFFSLGCMSGGLLFPKLHNLFKNNSASVFILLAAVSLIGCAMAKNIPILCVFIYFGGMGFSMTQASIMMLVGMLSAPEKVALASSIMMALFNLGMFLSSQMQELIGMITGDSLYMPLYIGAVVYVIISVFLRFALPLKSKQADKPENI